MNTFLTKNKVGVFLGRAGFIWGCHLVAARMVKCGIFMGIYRVIE